MSKTDKFLQYCRMTCFGGSEMGTCECKNPLQCEMQEHPEFGRYQESATERMIRIAKQPSEDGIASCNRCGAPHSADLAGLRCGGDDPTCDGTPTLAATEEEEQ